MLFSDQRSFAGILEKSGSAVLWTLCCGLFCLVYFVWGNFKKKDNLRKQTVPFLPFAAVPVFWMIIGEAAGGWKGVKWDEEERTQRKAGDTEGLCRLHIQ